MIYISAIVNNLNGVRSAALEQDTQRADICGQHWNTAAIVHGWVRRNSLNEHIAANLNGTCLIGKRQRTKVIEHPHSCHHLIQYQRQKCKLFPGITHPFLSRSMMVWQSLYNRIPLHLKMEIILSIIHMRQADCFVVKGMLALVEGQLLPLYSFPL